MHDGTNTDTASVSILDVPPARGTRAAFWEGFATPREGLRYMNRHPRLWRFAIIPLLLNLFITVLVLLGLLAAAGWFITVIHPWFDAGFWWRLLEIVVALAMLVIALLIAIVVWKFLEGVFCGYFYGKLARQVEIELGIAPDELREISFAREVADAAKDTAALVGTNVGLLALHLLPGIGSIIALAGSIYLSGFILGEDYLDYPLTLRGQRREQRKAFLKRHRPHVIGLGSCVFLVTLVPILGAVMLSSAAVGAVLLHRRLVRFVEPTMGVASTTASDAARSIVQ